jgi:hypothetical protein
MGLLNNSNRKRQTRAGDTRRGASSLEMLHRLVSNLPEPRDVFRQLLTDCMATNPKSTRYIVTLLAFYLHLGPFSRYVVGQIDEKIEALEMAVPLQPVKEPASAMM